MVIVAYVQRKVTKMEMMDVGEVFDQYWTWWETIKRKGLILQNT